MRRVSALFMAMVVSAISLSGCLNNTIAPGQETKSEVSTQVVESEKEEKKQETQESVKGDFNPDNISEHTFSLSTTASSGSALANVTHHFADRVSELSEGKIKVDVYEGSALGSEAQNLEALTAGTLDMAIIAVEFYVNSIPQVGAAILPYMYNDYDQAQKVFEGEAGKYTSQQILDVAKVKTLGYYIMAFRNMYTTKPLNSVVDLEGMKIRVPESALYVETFKMLGAAPTPLAMGEVYTAIDTGVVSGLENTPDTCLNNSFYEVAKYFNKTNHLIAPTTFSMSAKVFDSLNDDEKKLLEQAGLEASRYGLESTKTSDADFREQLKEKGMEFIESDVDSMREKIDYMAYPFMSSDEAKNLFELIQKTK